MSHEILIVDDEDDIRFQIAGILEDEGYETREAANSSDALSAVADRQPALVILDVWLAESELDGLQLLETFRRNQADMAIIMISGHATFDMAVSATKMGAYDFLAKPFKTDALLHTVQRAIDTSRLLRENRELREQTGGGEQELVGDSAGLQDVRRAIERVAATDSRVLITGPAGVGKGVVARIIHDRSNRGIGPFMRLSCAGMESVELEAELFGAEPEGDKPRLVGALEEAHGGTLLLDEVAEMPHETQGKLARVLHNTRFQRLGGSNWVEVDVRVIASTNRDLTAAMAAGMFREDLFYRLNVVPIRIEPLSDRREDIPPLARYLLARSAAAKGWTPRPLSEGAVAALQAHEWPGNGWELANVVERVLLASRDNPAESIGAEMVIEALGQGSNESARWDQAHEVMNLPLREAREAFEREYLFFHLTRFGGNISRTAEFVGMDRAALHRKLKMLGVQGQIRPQKASA